METQKLSELLRKYNAGQATDEEKAWIEEWYNQINGTDFDFDNEDEVERIKQEISSDLAGYLPDRKENAARSKHVLIRYPWIKWAAVITIFSIAAALYLQSSKQIVTAENHNNKSEIDDIAPGGHNAVLTLADGSKIILNEEDNGILINEGNASISKVEDGNLVYHTPENTELYSDARQNIITTPLGGEYRVTLSDGTKVWLNAASSLTFPAAFTGKERKVELTGEAYFEVARNEKMPFMLKVNDDIHLHVLGTHFNVMAYRDEKEVKATLLEGSVKISRNNSNRLLKPGQQAIIGQEPEIRTAYVNTEEVVAWKNGYFMFTDASLESIMQKISKWYAVDIVYQNKPKNLHFGGMVSRSKNISEVLKIMELTGSVHFKISAGNSSGKERRVTVMN